jgi:AcrR family transcriptional regulator
MSDAKPTSLRDAHTALTRSRILEGVIELLRRHALEDVTNAQIAAQAGVTERTFYRHFPTRDALDAGVWEHFTRQHLRRGFPETPEDLVAQPKVMFEGFDREEGLARWFVSSPRGHAIRLAVNDERRRAYTAAVREARPDLGEDDLIRLAGICQLLDSSFAWQSLKDYWGMSGAEAADAVALAVRTLIAKPPDTPDGS